jgi:hypothetical protein
MPHQELVPVLGRLAAMSLRENMLSHRVGVQSEYAAGAG